VQLSPVLFALDLPFMAPADKLTIGLGNIKIFDQSLMGVAVNLLGYNGGSVSQIKDFTGAANNVGVGVTEGVMHRVYDFWWSKTTHPKSVPVNGTHSFSVSGVSGIVSDLTSWASALLTGGFYWTDVDIDKVWADYQATIKFGKFSFNLKPGNVVEFSGSISADLAAQGYMQITAHHNVLIFPVGSDTSTLTLFDLSIGSLGVTIDHAEGEVSIDSQRRLTVKVTDLKLSIDLPWDIPEFFLNWIVNCLIDQVVKKMPPIVLFPAVVEEKIPGTAITVSLAVNKLEVNADEALIAAKVDTSGKNTYAPYVANTAHYSREAHKVGCEWAKKISSKNRVYYCRIEDALTDGFDGCYYCLPQYNTG
jgi:hypothetical protein